MTEPQWDALAGVWVGGRAAGSSFEPPDPLWIFGYGSLCWKTDFPYEESRVGSVRGWCRYFAQRSTDHRGTPDSPGLVATLLSDEQLSSLGLPRPAGGESVTCGVCYLVGSQDAQQVLDSLDVREKGGYTRAVVEFQTHGGGPTLRALLYSATPDNPGFEASAITDLTAAASTIGTACGPSGPNREYLLKLANWLDSVGETDDHVRALVEKLPPPQHRSCRSPPAP